MGHKELHAQPLLDWYDEYRRDLPWRAKPGQYADPYHVWLSEIMLQQTTVTAVKPYFGRFLELWPTVFDLAQASQDQVIEEWAGLGYYNRAKNLHKTAQVVAGEHKGVFPKTVEGLKKLPGIGDYTANAICAIAFDQKAVVVDGNVKRVVARLFGIEAPIKNEYGYLAELTQSIWPEERHSDFAQSLMDFGSMVCTPKSPSCHQCIFSESCVAKAKGLVDKIPNKGKKKPRPIKKTNAYVYIDEAEQELFLIQRPDSGILPNMLAPLMDEWLPQDDFSKIELQHKHHVIADHVVHIFTHLELHVRCTLISVDHDIKKQLPEGQWLPMIPETIDRVPSLTRKILKHAGCF